MTLTAIVRSKGTNRSEQLLAALCERAFLPLWCYPNTFRTHNKELADLLVVFGDDVVLFSDKAHRFPSTGDLELDWSRWKRESIDESVRQLKRARNWLRERPDQVYLDSRCQQPLPLRVNPRGRFHLVLVARNSRQRCQAERGGTGSLFIHGPTDIGSSFAGPFEIYLSQYGEFIHILDDVSLPTVLKELDTAPDFLRYLSEKEKHFGCGHIVSSFGEEETLTFYLRSTTLHRSIHHGERTFPTPPNGQPLIIGPGYWSDLKTRTDYVRKKRADQISYFWDSLVHSFGELVHQGTVPNPMGLDFEQLERIGRYLASETRLQRRTLSAAFVDKALKASSARNHYRTMFPTHRPEMAYVFVMCGSHGVDEVETQEDRHGLMFAYGQHTFRRARRIETIVAIATQVPPRAPAYYDFLLLHRAPLSPEQDALVDEAVGEHGWANTVAELDMNAHRATDFPNTPSTASRNPRQDSQRARRNLRKAQRSARRKTRQRAR